uniref:Uncharacterized protein n=1 Tax=Onchocerca volvulus TaxID=6282 RepID=A0A8R1XQU2_ONCVO
MSTTYIISHRFIRFSMKGIRNEKPVPSNLLMVNLLLKFLFASCNLQIIPSTFLSRFYKVLDNNLTQERRLLLMFYSVKYLMKKNYLPEIVLDLAMIISSSIILINNS